ncbi:MAG: GlxA family transcriptional regulator [Pseudomonadota bacterium]
MSTSEPTNQRTTPSGVSRYAFLLLSRFSLIAFSSAIEALRLANRTSGQSLYAWDVISLTGDPVISSNGLKIDVSGDVDSATSMDALILCGGVDIHRAATPELVSALQRISKQRRVRLGALDTGSYILAKAGLLSGYRCTIHWEHLAAMREEFTDLVVSPELFELDRDRFTSSGGTAPIDMMLNIIAREHGSDLSTAIADVLICDRIRGRHDRQRVPLRSRLGGAQPKLLEAVALMEANVEEPMSLNEIAEHISLSRRQLERLFQKHLKCVPTRYYLELRLERARQLLLQTSMSIVDVALASGFVSPPHFSKCYREYFGVPPRDERRRQRVLDTHEP